MRMSHSKLLHRVLPDLPFDDTFVDGLPFIERLRYVGRLVAGTHADRPSLDACWISDTVRGWYAMAVDTSLDVAWSNLIPEILSFARDHHFAVREWAWLAVRPRVVAEPLAALAALHPLLKSSIPFDRRFALEATRPRSVWGQHVGLFKREPELVEGFLRLVRCDESRYVRLAASNWINDVARSRRDWVIRFTNELASACSCPATTAIVRRARRSIKSDTGSETLAAASARPRS